MDYWIPEGGWTIDPPFVDDVYHPVSDLIECSDGRARTPAERDAWVKAIWGAVKDGAST